MYDESPLPELPDAARETWAGQCGLDDQRPARGKVRGQTLKEQAARGNHGITVSSSGGFSGDVIDAKVFDAVVIPMMMVEFYDDDKTELYDLSTDIGEHHDLAEHHPDRVAAMKAALDGWRRRNDVQYNTPNPDCNEAEYRRLHVDIDASTFDPVNADEEAWTRIRAWRRGMDEVYRKGHH